MTSALLAGQEPLFGLTSLPEATTPRHAPTRLSDSFDVVVCGSFRRSADLLRRDYEEFVEVGCSVVSPQDVFFVGERDGFVFAEHERDLAPSAIEREHIAKMKVADLVWLHTPTGYLGPSGAFELGVAEMCGVPVFAREAPQDIALAQYVTLAASPREAVELVSSKRHHRPGAPLDPLQKYYARIASLRGWDSETPTECLLLLSEEMGELMRAFRKEGGASRTELGSESETALELADVQLYVLHLANILGIDLSEAVSAKEGINAARFVDIGKAAA